MALAELKPLFEAAGNLFLYENRIRETEGVRQAIDDGMHARYLYQFQLAKPVVNARVILVPAPLAVTSAIFR
jgi:hypothetical protein